MFLAPLNYDRFFKKVFSDKDIAKRFLEDFLEIEIEEIENLPTKHKITDDAIFVEFDYRCKINGNYVIVDMQQWYKPDIVQRFFMYHCLNTSLQLEKIEKKVITNNEENKKNIVINNYRKIEPVITLVWLVSDTIGFVDNYESFSFMNQKALDFINDFELFSRSKFDEIEKKRKELLKIINNDKKNLDFLGKNKLIFMFQKNIVKSKKIKKYVDWFVFAEKTLNRENTENDFKEFQEDVIFREITKRLNKNVLTESDLKYVDDEEKVIRMLGEHEGDILADGIKEGKKQGLEEGKKLGIDEGMKEGMKQSKLEIAKNLLDLLDDEKIVLITGLGVEDIIKLREDFSS